MIKPLEALDMIVWRLTSHEDDLKLRATDEKEINIIQEALKRLEKLEQENQELKERQKDILNANVELSFENYKLKKALDKACERLDWDCPVSQELIDDLDCENNCHCDIDYAECWKKYFLRAVSND